MFAKIAVSLLLLILWIVNLVSHKCGWRLGVFVTKPCLMLLLLVLYLLMASEVNVLVVLALSFGWIGDLFLLWVEKKVCLICGMTVFLLGHIMYITIFLESTHFLSVVPDWFYFFILPFISYGMWVFSKLVSFVGKLKVPVLLYMVTIITMSYTSLTRVWAVSGEAFWLPFAGSLCFLTSDTLLAFLTFRGGIRDGNVWVMSTYVLAQILIVMGLA